MKVLQDYDGCIVDLDSNDELYVGEGVANCDGFMSREEAEATGIITHDIDTVEAALINGNVVAVNGGDNDEFFLVSKI